MEEISFRILGRPTVKKNTQRVVGYGKSRRVIYSEAYEAWAKLAAPQILNQNPKRIFFSTPVEVNFVFDFLNHQWEPDLSACLEGIQDMLQSCGVLKDDKLIVKLTAEKTFGKAEGMTVTIRPRAHITEK